MRPSGYKQETDPDLMFALNFDCFKYVSSGLNYVETPWALLWRKQATVPGSTSQFAAPTNSIVVGTCPSKELTQPPWAKGGCIVVYFQSSSSAQERIAKRYIHDVCFMWSRIPQHSKWWAVIECPRGCGHCTRVTFRILCGRKVSNYRPSNSETLVNCSTGSHSTPPSCWTKWSHDCLGADCSTLICVSGLIRKQSQAQTFTQVHVSLGATVHFAWNMFVP